MNPWLSLNINEYQCISMNIHGNPLKSLIFMENHNVQPPTIHNHPTHPSDQPLPKLKMDRGCQHKAHAGSWATALLMCFHLTLSQLGPSSLGRGCGADIVTKPALAYVGGWGGGVICFWKLPFSRISREKERKQKHCHEICLEKLICMMCPL